MELGVPQWSFRSRCGLLELGYARELFDEIIVHCGDVVKGTAMLLGHTEREKNEDPIQFYPQMFLFWYVQSMW